MSAVQNAVAAYNEFADKFIKFMNTTTGRDRINGLVQFAAQFLAWYTARKGYAKETTQSWRNLMAAVATSRRLFRIGRTQEFMRAISKSSSIRDDVVRYLQILRSIALALWLSNDMLVWFHTVGFRTYPNAAQIAVRANRFWLAGALCGVAQDAYKLRGNAAALERAAAGQARGELGKDGGKKELEVLGAQRKEYLLQTVQDVLEAVLAASLLGLVRIDEGAFSLVGLAATGLGFRTGWRNL
ncbi:peroxisomal biogenesis factor 11 [Hyaloraphidium curvatum]|nr:peroxisomal biogenesis factor 11 [Hyaloraphidium curvatum]